MGKKEQTLEELLEIPWCYYCERDFDDNKVLQDHQRARHFKCHHCNRRLNTINGLRVHSEQVHKAPVTEIDNCTVPERNDVDREIFGMQGIPEEVLQAHRTRVTNEYYKRQNEWKMKTGNPISGPNPNQKKRDFEEDKEAFKARLEEHKRKRRAEKAAKKAGLTDDGAGDESAAASQTAAISQVPYTGVNGFDPNAPATTGPQYGIALPAYNPAYPPPFPGGPPLPPNMPMPYPPSGGFGEQPPFGVGGHGYPPPAAPFPAPGPFPPGLPPMPQAGYLPPHPIPGQHAYLSGMSPSPIPFAGSPPSSSFATPPSLPSALPSRPSFNMPNISREDMEKMHSGSRPQQQVANTANADAVEDLIAGILAEKDAKSSPRDGTPGAQPGNTATTKSETRNDEKTEEQTAPADSIKPEKKKKESRLVVHTTSTDPELSLEEVMAGWGVYRRVSDKPKGTVTDLQHANGEAI